MSSDDLKKIIVLDRDGVINRESKNFIKSADEWQPLPGSIEAIAALTGAGFAVVVATNQSGLGRGLFDQNALDDIHGKMIGRIQAAGGELHGIFVCPHHPDQGCDCRKPRPGLMKQIESAFSTSLAGQPVIGDSMRDLEAAKAVGARTILVRTGNGSETQELVGKEDDIEIFDDLADAAHHLIDRVD